MPKDLQHGLLLFGSVAAGWAIWWQVSGAPVRENNEHLNRAIFPAFRAIEAACVAEKYPLQTVRCQQAFAAMNRCTGGERSCDAVEYYEMLAGAGFDLPPLYQAGYQPK